MVKHLAGVSAVYFVLDIVNNPHVVDDVGRSEIESFGDYCQLSKNFRNVLI